MKPPHILDPIPQLSPPCLLPPLPYHLPLPRILLDDVFLTKDEIAKDVQEELQVGGGYARGRLHVDKRDGTAAQGWGKGP
jgi:hypothetical protein